MMVPLGRATVSLDGLAMVVWGSDHCPGASGMPLVGKEGRSVLPDSCCVELKWVLRTKSGSEAVVHCPVGPAVRAEGVHMVGSHPVVAVRGQHAVGQLCAVCRWAPMRTSVAAARSRTCMLVSVLLLLLVGCMGNSVTSSCTATAGRCQRVADVLCVTGG